MINGKKDNPGLFRPKWNQDYLNSQDDKGKLNHLKIDALLLWRPVPTNETSLKLNHLLHKRK